MKNAYKFNVVAYFKNTYLNLFDKSIKTKPEKEALDELFEEHPEIIQDDKNISYIKDGYPE